MSIWRSRRRGASTISTLHHMLVPLYSNHPVGTADDFPGKYPLHDTLLSALKYLKKEGERHPNVEADSEHINHIKKLESELKKLRATLEKKHLDIKSKEQLIKVKDETLEANKALIAEKERTIKVRDSPFSVLLCVELTSPDQKRVH